MKKMHAYCLFILACVVGSSSAFGQAGIAVSPVTGTVGTGGGATTPATFNVNFTNTTPTATINAIQTEIQFDNTQLTIGVAGAGGAGCSINSGTPNTVSIVAFAVSGTVASGNLCTLTVTAASPQSAGTTYNLNVTNTACSDAGAMAVACTETDSVITVVAGPTAVAPTVSALSDTTLTAGTGSVPVTVATAGVATADLALNCSIPASTASFAITGGATRTINAPATLGANAPAIGLSCTPQSGVVTSTLTCTQTATPSEARADLTAVITCPAASTTPAAPTVPSIPDTTLTGGVGSVPVVVTTAGVATASLDMSCSIPSGGATAFTITGGATRTINAPATVGANAPAIGLTCVPGASIVTGTLTCTQTATPGGTGSTSATITCPASAPTAAAPTVVTPTVNLSGATGSTQSGNATFGNTGGTAYNITSCTPPTGFSTTATFPLSVAAGGNVNVAVQCTVPQASGLMGCVQSASATVLEVNLTCSVAAAPLPTVAVPTMSNAAKVFMVLLMMGFGLVGFQLYRRGA